MPHTPISPYHPFIMARDAVPRALQDAREADAPRDILPTGYREKAGDLHGRGERLPATKGPVMRLALSRWALLLGLLVGGCAAGPSPAVRGSRPAGDPCPASGGVMVGATCYPGSKDPSDEWSARKLQEMQREWDERQPGRGRLR